MTSKTYTDVVCRHTLADALDYFVCLAFHHFCNTMCGLKIYSKLSCEFYHATAIIPHDTHIDHQNTLTGQLNEKKIHLFVIKLSKDFRNFPPQKYSAFLIK